MSEQIVVVVRNDEEQYSVWPADREPPPGWHDVGVSGTTDQCLDHIEQVWTGTRPKSLRAAMDGGD
jgi:MbtH protein